VGLAEAVSRVRKSGFTFAPETGSDRLRRVINKTFTNADMVRAAEAAYSKGWQLIKVYAMIGLPTETDDDLEELARLAEEILAAGRRATGGRKVQVKVSVGCFIPKAWTPFQWQPFAGVDELHRRIDLLKHRFKRIRGARFTWSRPEESALEALLSRGGRNLSAAIERAHDLGSVFDGWSDHIDLDAWRRAVNDFEIDVRRELGQRELTQTLPWDLIDAGVRKGYLKAEWRRALREAETEDCKWGRCYHCGIPGDGDDTQLAKASLPVLGEPLPMDERPKVAAYRLRPEPRLPKAHRDRPQPPVHRRYRFTFSKTGDARFLSHRQVMDAFERVLRAAGLPVHYTEGFNPHIRLSMGPALALGHEGTAEIFDVDCTAPITASHRRRANSLLPDGVEILDAHALLPGAPSLGRLLDSTEYRIAPSANGSSWPETPEALEPELRRAVRSWRRLDDGSLQVEINARQEAGPTPSVKKILKGLGLNDEEAALARATREKLVLKPKQKSGATSPTVVKAVSR
jgi:radical SAM-linked protein